jgi:hypothetical protein
MEPKIEAKLLGILSDFRGSSLESAEFKDKRVNGKNLLTLELTFTLNDRSGRKVMVLVLNRDITLSDCEDIYGEVID